MKILFAKEGRGCWLALVLLPGVALTAQTEEDGDATSGPLETVVVTATRREAEARDVSAAVSGVGSETLRAAAPDVVAEVLRGTPGAFFQQTTPGQGIPIIRGLKGSQVLHLVDGIRLNNAFFRDAPNQYLGLVDPLMLDRVEVLRGAAGSLYGADAIGGVVHLLTRETRFDHDLMDTRYRLYGSWDSADRGWTGRAEAATGNRSGSLAGGVSWQERGDRRTGGGERVRPTAFDARAGDLKLLLGVPERGEWKLSVQSLEQPDTPRVDELVPGFGQETPAAEQYRFAPNRRSLFHGRYRRAAVGPLESVELAMARQVITDDRITQGFGNLGVVSEQNESTLDGFTMQAAQSTGSHLVFTWGAEIYRDTVRSARQLRLEGSEETDSIRPRFPDGSSLDSDAVFLDAAWTPPGPWAVDAGVRYSRFDIRLPATTEESDVRLDPDDLTGDLRLRYALADGVRLVANLGRGFRPPNVFDLGALGPRPGNRFNVANPDLGPETAWSYDLGVKAWGPRWSLEAYLFHIDYRDRITSVPTGERTPDGRIVVRSENRNRVRLEGLEAGGTWTFSDRLEATAVLNWTRGEERDDRGFNVPADRVPPLNGRLGLTWRPLPDWRLEPFVDFAARQDRLSPRDERDPRIDPEGTPGWATVNLHLQWALRETVDVGLRLENLLDEEYREHGSGLDAPGFNIGLWADLRFH